jgi:hypothetical protein
VPKVFRSCVRIVVRNAGNAVSSLCSWHLKSCSVKIEPGIRRYSRFKFEDGSLHMISECPEVYGYLAHRYATE